MRALRVVGITEGDGETSIILEDPVRRERYTVPADEQLRAAARGDLTRLGQIAIELESQLRPREIQARIRAGASVEQVAAVAGVPAQKIERFAYPVLLERSRTAEVARRAHPVRTDGPDSRVLEEVVAHTFGLRGQDYADAEWDSWKGEDGRWVVALSWRAGRSDNQAHWTFQPGAHGGTVTAVDEHASDLVEGLPARPLRPVGPVIDIGRSEEPAPAPDELRAAASSGVRPGLRDRPWAPERRTPAAPPAQRQGEADERVAQARAAEAPTEDRYPEARLWDTRPPGPGPAAGSMAGELVPTGPPPARSDVVDAELVEDEVIEAEVVEEPTEPARPAALGRAPASPPATTFGHVEARPPTATAPAAGPAAAAPAAQRTTPGQPAAEHVAPEDPAAAGAATGHAAAAEHPVPERTATGQAVPVDAAPTDAVAAPTDDPAGDPPAAGPATVPTASPAAAVAAAEVTAAGPPATRPDPTGPAPTGSAPAGSAPTVPVSAGAVPTASAPTGPAPTGPASTGSAPAGSVPTASAPDEVTEPVPAEGTGSASAEPVPDEPVPTGTDSAGPTPAGTAPTGSHPTGPAPATPAATGTPAASARPAAPDTTGTDGAAPTAAAAAAEPAAAQAPAEDPEQPAATPAPARRTKKGKPVMPSWDEVLLGVRGQR